MQLRKTSQLFFGCKLDSKLREALAQAKPGERRYFEDPSNEFLRVVTTGDSDEQWIGKVTKAGMTFTEAEDIQRNVISILRRIASGIRISPTSIKIFAMAEDAKLDADSDSDGDSSGPYIANY